MTRPIVAVGAPPTVPLAALTAPSEVAAVIDAVREFPGEILLATRDAESRRVARAVRLLLGADRVGILHAAVPYTAWVATIQIVATMPPDVDLSRAGEIAAALVQSLRTRVVLSSVASLEAPSPTLKQHVRGLFPGAAFDVDLSAGTVGRLAGPVSAQSSLVVVARSVKPLGGRTDIRLPEGRLELGAVDAGWRASRWIEVTALDEQQWYAATADLRAPLAGVVHCHACGRPGTQESCLFCEIPLSAGALARADAVTVGGVPE